MMEQVGRGPVNIKQGTSSAVKSERGRGISCFAYYSVIVTPYTERHGSNYYRSIALQNRLLSNVVMYKPKCYNPSLYNKPVSYTHLDVYKRQI